MCRCSIKMNTLSERYGTRYPVLHRISSSKTTSAKCHNKGFAYTTVHSLEIDANADYIATSHRMPPVSSYAGVGATPPSQLHPLRLTGRVQGP